MYLSITLFIVRSVRIRADDQKISPYISARKKDSENINNSSNSNDNNNYSKGRINTEHK